MVLRKRSGRDSQDIGRLTPEQLPGIVLLHRNKFPVRPISFHERIFALFHDLGFSHGDVSVYFGPCFGLFGSLRTRTLIHDRRFRYRHPFFPAGAERYRRPCQEDKHHQFHFHCHIGFCVIAPLEASITDCGIGKMLCFSWQLFIRFW